MKKYTPKDPLPLPPLVAGTGVFTRLLIPDDGDKRKAAIYAAALEAVANGLEWIRYRLMNGLEGGTYDVPLSFTNLQTIGSHKPSIRVTSGLDVDKSVHLKDQLVADGDVVCSQNVIGSRAYFQQGNVEDLAVSQTITTRDLLFSGLLGFMDGIMIDKTLKTRQGKTVREGSSAYEAYRRVTADVSKNNTVDPTTFDMLVIPGPGAVAGVVITLAAPPGNATINPFWIVRRLAGAQPNTVTIHTNLGNTLARFPQGNNTLGAIQVMFDGTEYFAVPAILGVDSGGAVTAFHINNVLIP